MGGASSAYERCEIRTRFLSENPNAKRSLEISRNSWRIILKLVLQK
jgi:hypothetical protein